MKKSLIGLSFIILIAQWSLAQNSTTEQQIKDLSKVKWQWMADKNVDKLTALFHEKSKFVHMSGTWKKNEELEIINLSKQKWLWMADKNVDSLSVLFDAKAMFVHMGGTWGKEREVDIIKTGFIWYKKAEVYSASTRFFGKMAIF